MKFLCSSIRLRYCVCSCGVLVVSLLLTQAVERAVKVLDHMPPYDTHKIGVVYVSKGQVSGALIH